MEFETPATLLGRLKLGREEFCQRLLTTLILHAPYPRWNTRSVPGEAGLRFLQDVYELSFRDSWPGNDLLWIWRPESTGRAMTTAGEAFGRELRVSSYGAPQY